MVYTHYSAPSQQHRKARQSAASNAGQPYANLGKMRLNSTQPLHFGRNTSEQQQRPNFIRRFFSSIWQGIQRFFSALLSPFSKIKTTPSQQSEILPDNIIETMNQSVQSAAHPVAQLLSSPSSTPYAILGSHDPYMLQLMSAEVVKKYTETTGKAPQVIDPKVYTDPQLLKRWLTSYNRKNNPTLLVFSPISYGSAVAIREMISSTVTNPNLHILMGVDRTGEGSQRQSLRRVLESHGRDASSLFTFDNNHSSVSQNYRLTPVPDFPKMSEQDWLAYFQNSPTIKTITDKFHLDIEQNAIPELIKLLQSFHIDTPAKVSVALESLGFELMRQSSDQLFESSKISISADFLRTHSDKITELLSKLQVHDSTSLIADQKVSVVTPDQIDIGFDDIVGLEQPKRIVSGWLKHPNLFGGDKNKLLPLLYGPSGTGKTMLMRAAAKEAGGDVAFVETSMAKLGSKYVGETGHNILALRQVIEDLPQQRVILYIDEIDSIGSRENASNNTNSSLTAERNNSVNALLQLLDGFASHFSKQVMIVSSANNKDFLDLSILSRIQPIEVGLPERADHHELLGRLQKRYNVQFEITAALLSAVNGFSPRDLSNFIEQILRQGRLHTLGEARLSELNANPALLESEPLVWEASDVIKELNKFRDGKNIVGGHGGDLGFISSGRAVQIQEALAQNRLKLKDATPGQLEPVSAGLGYAQIKTALAILTQEQSAPADITLAQAIEAIERYKKASGNASSQAAFA